MRAILIAILAAGAIGLVGLSGATAAPVNNAAIAGSAATLSPIVKARLYCYRHYTRTSRRRFLHWGRC
jgi:hypothetical protein